MPCQGSAQSEGRHNRRIVNDDEDGRFLGGCCQEAERRRSHGEPVARRGAARRRAHRKARPPGARESGGAGAGTGVQQLEQTRERQRGVRLQRMSAQHLEISRRRGGQLEQSRLPDARFTVDEQRRTLPAAGPGAQAVKSRLLLFSANQHRSHRNLRDSRRTVQRRRQT